MLSSKLLGIIEAVEGKLSALSPEVMSHQAAPGRWSKKQILGHLIDSAYNNHQRFLRAPYQEVLDRATSDHEFHRMAMRAFPEGAPATLGFLIEDYLFHLVHHLKQILPGFEGDWYAGYQRSADEFRLG